MMKVDEILSDLTSNGARIEVVDDALKISVDGGIMTPEVYAFIKDHKADIIRRVRELNTGVRVGPRKAYYPASSAQQRLFFQHDFNQTSLAYNLPEAVRLEGELDRARLVATFAKLIARHESLRTSFAVIDGVPVQKIAQSAEFLPEYFEAAESGLPEITARFIRPFDLGQAPLLRAGLVALGPREHILLFDMHHIIADGTSQSILVKDFMRLYNHEALPGLSLQYKEYAEWQQSEGYRWQERQQQAFWLREFAEATSPLGLPGDFPRPLTRRYEGDAVGFTLTEAETRRLKAVAEGEAVTEFMLILAVYNVLLNKLTGQEDIVVGTPVAGRPGPEWEAVTGVFVNTLPLRNYPKGELTFRAFLSALKGNTLACFDHQSFPYEQLIQALKLRQDAGGDPLIDVMYVHQNFEQSVLRIPGLTLRPCPLAHHKAKFDLTLTTAEVHGQLHFNFEYSTELFKAETAGRFAGYFKRIFALVTADPAVRLADVELVTPAEKQQLLQSFAPAAARRAAGPTVLDRFKAQAAAHPGRVALTCRAATTTYGELEAQSDRIAAYLRDKQHVRAGDLVGVALERDIYLIPFVLGVLKAGGVYVPLDPQYPAERQQAIVAGARLKALITRGQAPGATPADVAVVDAGQVLAAVAGAPRPVALPAVEEAQLAYVIHTSGSTGRPKGVMVTHRSLAAYAGWAADAYVQGEAASFSLFTSIGFDLTLTSIFVPLVTGNAIHVYPEDQAHFTIDTVLAHNQAEVVKLTPSHLRLIRDSAYFKNPAYRSRIRRFVVGGEELTTQLAKDIDGLFGGAVEICNEYGPTEATVGCMIHRYDPQADSARTVPIGRPIDDCRIFLFDKFLKPVPDGIAGEIYIAGAGVAQGYLHNEALTRERFIDNPYAGGEVLYKTGDLARRAPDGTFVFLGRKDDQVKIRGFRIELGEIEQVLLGFGPVRKAAVLVREKAGEKHLVAYFVADGGGVAELKQYLSERLPAYMVPAYLVPLEAMALTPNGKLDTRSLPEPAAAAGAHAARPAGAVEEKLAAIWAEVIDIDQETVDVHASFFALGGHSLTTFMLLHRVEAAFGVRIGLVAFFGNPTIKALSEHIARSASQPGTYASIPKAAPKESYPLSSAQKRLYFLHQFDRSSLAYNIPQAVRLTGPLDRDRVAATFGKLAARHESLRTSFRVVAGEPVQQVAPRVEIPIGALAPTGDEAETLRNFCRPFQLDQAPLLRVALLPTAPAEHLLLVDMHHIISDGVSQDILVKDFMRLYNGEELPELHLQYTDYAEWQQGAQRDEIARQRDFWLGEFSQEAPILELPADFSRPPVRSHRGDAVDFALPARETAALKAIAEGEGATLFMVLLSVYTILLSKLTGQEDIVVGTPVAGRLHPDTQPMIGMFVNTLPLRNAPAGTLRYPEFLAAVRTKTLQCFEHQAYPYEALISELKVARDTGRNPLFDAVLAYQNFAQTQLAIPGLTLTPYRGARAAAKFDLTLSVLEKDGQLLLNFEYPTDLFRRETIERFSHFFGRVVAAVVADPAVQLADLALISDEEQHQVLHAFNATAVPYPADRPIAALFEEQVRQSPDQVAVADGALTLTYRELNERANQVARRLQSENIARQECVGVLASRSAAAVVAIVGILKAGGAYLPLDAEYPAERLHAMLEDGQVRVVLAEEAYEHLVPQALTRIDLGAAGAGEPAANPAPVNAATDLAYVMYTSGSTGRPKGIGVTHRNVVRLVKNANYVTLNAETRILQTGAPAFDATTFEIWGCLLNGGSLYLADKETLLRTGKLGRMLAQCGINTLWLTSSLFNQHAQEDAGIFAPVRYLLVGGDALSPHFINQVRDRHPGIQIINGYGPTENTTFSVCHRIEQRYAHTVPIGKPISNSTAYILDRHGKLQPVGVAGELCVGGDGVSRGYLNDDALTAAKFVANPFAPGQRMYRTGDLARWLPGGIIEFLGRMDNQVKVRGFRIELGEIEGRLNAHPDVKEAAVVIREQAGDKHLVAYYAADAELAGLRSHLAGTLPGYMVPDQYVRLERLPLTANGKLDKRALPEPELRAAAGFVAPAGETEQKLAALWAEVLKIDQAAISATANFFELGGHSLRATVLANKIAAALGVEVPLQAIFKHQDIRSLGTFIGQAGKSGQQAIGKAPAKASYALSSAQKRLFILNQFDAASVAYNMPQVVRLTGTLDKARLEGAFTALVARHASLRTQFELAEGEPVQKILPAAGFTIAYREAEEREADGIIREFIRPFDLSRGPLLRVGLVTLGAATHLLLVDMHHIITDGVSQGVLIGEFMALYNGEELPALRLQYHDYAEWQQSELRRAEMTRQQDFWLRLYDELPDALELPYDHQRPLAGTHRGGVFRFAIGPEETRALKRLAEVEGATLFMVLLAAYNVLLGRLGNREDIVVGTPVAGRRHADLEGMNGMFVNTLPLRNQPLGTLSFRAFLREVKARTLAGFDHQDFQYEALIDQLKLERSTGRNPLFDVLFAYDNFEPATLAIPGLRLEPYAYAQQTTKFDLTLTAGEWDQQLALRFDYATDLFGEDTIARFAAYLGNIASAVASDADARLADIEIVTAQEQQAIAVHARGARAAYPPDVTVIDCFEQTAAEHPHRTAVVCNGEELQYQALRGQVNGLVGLMREKGVRKGDRVAVLIENSIELLISLLATMKCGATFVPIDTHWPLQRQNECLASVAPALVLGNAPITGLAVENHLAVHHAALPSAPEAEKAAVGPDDPMYIIFTSGSTGTPKGVAVPYKGIMNRLFWMNDFFGAGAASSVLQATRYVYDSAVWELFWPLINAGQTIILPPAFEMTCDSICDLIEKYRIGLVDFVPSVFNTLFEYAKDPGSGMQAKLQSMRYVIQGGEEISEKVTRQFMHHFPDVAIINLYGPTEASIGCIYHPVQRDGTGKIPIGKPIANVTIHITDPYGNEVPWGVRGELCISGVCLALGYYNNAPQTEARFVCNDRMQHRVYKTGDLARRLPDGNIEFSGRIDDQVKIRGFRVEPGEIAARLAAHERVQDVFVTAKERGGHKYIVAYYVSPAPLEVAALRSHLAEKLPGYMIPSYFCHLEALPVTSHGKVDRKALPEPQFEPAGVPVQAASQTQQGLAEVWAEVLGLRADAIGIHANFFDIGGNSLKLISAVHKINRKFNAQLPVTILFELPTIALLAQRLDRTAQAGPAAEAEENAAEELSDMVGLFNADDDE